MTNTQTKRECRIVTGSMGSFLLPPLHPGYKFRVEGDLRRKKENRGTMSLEYAAKECYCEIAKKEAIELINEWKTKTRLPLDNAEVQQWINACINHMGKTNAAKHIKEYYPEYKGITT